MTISWRKTVLGVGFAAGVATLGGSAQSQQGQGQGDQRFPQTRDFQQMREAQQAQARDRISTAIQRVQSACQQELRNFCSTVTPGEGRLLLCMQAHEDKLSQGCELALFEASRNIEYAVRRVERIADACWNDIQAHCASAGGSIAQCISEKSGAFSPQCQGVVAAFRQATSQQGAKQQPAMSGVPIYSSDGMRLGLVTGIKTRADGGVEAIEAEIGSLLGLGATAVLISPSDLEWRGDRIELRMGADQVRSILDSQRR